MARIYYYDPAVVGTPPVVVPTYPGATNAYLDLININTFNSHREAPAGTLQTMLSGRKVITQAANTLYIWDVKQTFVPISTRQGLDYIFLLNAAFALYDDINFVPPVMFTTCFFDLKGIAATPVLTSYDLEYEVTYIIHQSS